MSSQPFGFLGLVQSWEPEREEKKLNSKVEPTQVSMQEETADSEGMNLDILPNKLKCRIVTYSAKAMDFGQPGAVPWLAKKSLGWKRLTIYQKLHDEILLFHEWIKPRNRDIQRRSSLFKRYEDAIKNHFGKHTDVKVFGSTATNLFLPNSDLDIVIVDNSDSEVLQKGQMSSKLGKLMRKIWNMSSERLLVKHAKTPVLKLTDSTTKLQVDITFNKHEKSVAAAELTKSLLLSNEHIAPLTLVLKSFLYCRDLNSNANRGIGGYGLVLWVTAFIKIHDELYPPDDVDDTADNRLGKLFLHFLHFFGHCFDYQQIGLAPCGVGNDSKAILFVRRSFSAMDLRSKASLAIMDPLDPSNNVTANSTRIDEITHHFREALDTILAKKKQIGLQTTVNGVNVTYLGYLSRILTTVAFVPKNDVGSEPMKKKRKVHSTKQDHPQVSPKKSKKKLPIGYGAPQTKSTLTDTASKPTKKTKQSPSRKSTSSEKDFAKNIDFIPL
jgi:DNA polymerase sigma